MVRYGVQYYLILFLGSSLILQSSCASETATAPTPTDCGTGQPVETGGVRRLALIVGVGDYLQEKIPDLAGPPQDARRFRELLTDRNGYGFPPENVCMLLNEQATLANFRQAFEDALVARARAQDVAVLYFAGHGSQVKDRNGDEPDELDETLVLQDSRTGDVPDLTDDELNGMLARLQKQTRNISVFLDSCNSGTATRGEDSSFQARFIPVAENQKSPGTEFRGDGSAEWAPQDLEGVVFFSAAGDGTPALETGGRGVFTDALLQVLSDTGKTPLTYSQAARRIPSLVRAMSYQIPYFQGRLDSVVFGNTDRKRPLAWEVTAVGPPVELSGPPLPGITPGAELRIYSGSAQGSDTSDPSKAKATVVVREATGVNAVAEISTRPSNAPALEKGDLARLVRPGDQYLRLKVRLRPASEPGGLPKPRATQLREAILANPESHLLVELNPDRGEFEFRLDRSGRLQLLGPENRVRITFEKANELKRAPENLWQHARQRALLLLHGEGGSDFRDNETLQVRLVEASKQSPCSKGGWVQADFSQEQVVPLCHSWNLQVKLAENTPKPLLIGGVLLSSDGSIFGFPRGGQIIRLGPGESHTFTDWKGTGSPPLDVQDHILVFGTQETNPVRWDLLTATAASRGPAQGGGFLYRSLDAYLNVGSRGQTVETDVEETTWSVTRLSVRTEANARFLEPDQSVAQPKKREYTIPDFDIRPYLPDDPNSPLFRVLQKADFLAKYSTTDGVPYKQHDWSLATDALNLGRGIDCSRSIWFAFTRSGLPFNRSDAYLSTADMVTEKSRMADQFDRCDDDTTLRTGDVLVYRDAQRSVGHVIMVIDPTKRIAWGSHGWDGNVKEGLESDTGVEYQLLKYKKDWERFDRATMQRKACWRYRKFFEESTAPLDAPGVAALENACSPSKCN